MKHDLLQDVSLVSSIARLTELVTDQADKIVAITTELDESKAENKKLLSTINTLEGRIEECENLNETKTEIAGLRSDIYAKIEAFEVEQNKNINGTKAGMEGLRSDLSAKIEILEDGQADQKRNSSDLYAKIELLEVEQIGQNKNSSALSAKIEVLEVEQIEQNKNSSALSAKIEVLEVEQIEQNKNSSALSAKIEVLEVKQNENINRTKTDIEGLKVELSGISSYKNETKTDMKSLEIKLKQTIEGVKTNTSSEISDVLAKVEEISWPEGHYCILGSGGSCPEGFTRDQGWAKAIWTYSNSGYTHATTFGDSSIRCRTGCSYGSNNWNVDK